MDFDKIIMICRTYGVTISFTYEKFPDSLKLRLYYLPTAAILNRTERTNSPRMGSSVMIPMAELCKSMYPDEIVLHYIKEGVRMVIGNEEFDKIPFDWKGME